ncbi:MAG: hypothetical protein LKE29_10820 [Acidaminococcaceae bacterium]|nr:hypothetical protein [Acidaminococcaceae bacterium]
MIKYLKNQRNGDKIRNIENNTNIIHRNKIKIINNATKCTQSVPTAQKASPKVTGTNGDEAPKVTGNNGDVEPGTRGQELTLPMDAKILTKE